MFLIFIIVFQHVVFGFSNIFRYRFHFILYRFRFRSERNITTKVVSIFSDLFHPLDKKTQVVLCVSWGSGVGRLKVVNP